jgi:DNA-binding MarR family transcriptional regulator
MTKQLTMIAKVGRPALLTPAQLIDLRAVLEHCCITGDRFPLAELACRFQVSASTVSRAARKLRAGIDEVLS